MVQVFFILYNARNLPQNEEELTAKCVEHTVCAVWVHAELKQNLKIQEIYFHQLKLLKEFCVMFEMPTYHFSIAITDNCFI